MDAETSAPACPARPRVELGAVKLAAVNACRRRSPLLVLFDDVSHRSAELAKIRKHCFGAKSLEAAVVLGTYTATVRHDVTPI